MIKLITKKDKIKGVFQKWANSYRYWKYDDNKQKIGERLRGVTDEKEITKIIGNDSWTSNVCNECHNDCNVIIQLGEEPDYESATVHICSGCLEKALKLVNVSS